MDHAPRNRNPALGGGMSNAAGGQSFHVQNASAEPLLQRLEGIQKQGNGWRARCPACGGMSRKLSVAEAGDRVLVHCFAGCAAAFRGLRGCRCTSRYWADLGECDAAPPLAAKPGRTAARAPRTT